MVSGIILAGLGAGLWAVTDYIENTLRPRQEAARLARIDSEIVATDALFERGRCDKALHEYRFLFEAYAAELTPGVKGGLKDRIGQCYMALAEDGETEKNLGLAIEAFKDALAFRPAAAPADFAATQAHLGDAYRALAGATGARDALTEARAAFERALEVANPTADPASYAAGQRRLGNVYRDLYVLSAEGDELDGAFARYEAALKAAPPQEFPEEYGLTLIEIGEAYVALSEHGYRRRHLEQAVSSFEKALAVFDAHALPRLYAETQKRIGDTYMRLAQTKPANRSDRAAHEQRLIVYQNKASAAYRVAQSFGFQPDPSVLAPPRAAAAAPEPEPEPEPDEK